MYSVTKIFHVPIGHRLSKHKGKCKFLHGHNLKIEVSVQSSTLDFNDMVIDFSNLKIAVGNIIESWDHGMFLNCEDPESKNIENCNLHTSYSDPTAEALCKLLYDQVGNYLYGLLDRSITVKEIAIWEADDSKATYSE